MFENVQLQIKSDVLFWCVALITFNHQPIEIYNTYNLYAFLIVIFSKYLGKINAFKGEVSQIIEVSILACSRLDCQKLLWISLVNWISLRFTFKVTIFLSFRNWDELSSIRIEKLKLKVIQISEFRETRVKKLVLKIMK